MVYLLLLSLLCVISAAEILPCKDGWSFYKDANKCIKVNEESKSWYDAQSVCQNEGGRLLTIPDTKTQNFVNQLLVQSTRYLWIGLSDITSEYAFKWVDGRLLCGSYQHWAPLEPNNLYDEDCVHLLDDSLHHWNDKGCGYQYSFICEKRGPGCEYMNGGCSGSCTDATGGGWGMECSCDEGYAVHNGECYDVNECSVGNGGCNSDCENTDGSFKCTCNIDYIYNGTHCVIDDGNTLIG